MYIKASSDKRGTRVAGCLHAEVLDKSILLPAVKIAWLDSSALACSACQRADALAVDTL